VNEDSYKKREEHKVADNHEWQIGYGTFAELCEWEATHGEQKDIG
jgi:hypothetical protein